MTIDVPRTLTDTTASLCCFLEAVLPTLSADWWGDTVLPSLSYHQQQLVERTGTGSLGELDLAGLLRVMDGN